ncbi:peptidylprolyl isomerase [Opitutaceae bacterium TAV5]|nr:peptidylprolyl isomerase [Opitutaceae bacterium TAV5]
MRSFLYVLLLGFILLAIGIVVRTGIAARKHPGVPINAAMRQALADEARELPTHDAKVIGQQFAADKVVVTESGLRYIVQKPGVGEAMPKRGQVATVNYTGRLVDGTPFDSSAEHGGPFNFQAGMGRVIAGWDEAVLSMKKGERRTLIVPFWLAYGEKGIRGKIEPRATLIFDVELVDFR